MTTAGVWDAIVAASCGTAGCRKLLRVRGRGSRRLFGVMWGVVEVKVVLVSSSRWCEAPVQHRRPAPLPRAERDETRRIAPARPNSRHTSNVVHHPRLPVQQTNAVPTCLIHMA
jgi:hypothetical protein